MAQITSPLESAAQNVTTSSTKERVAIFEGSIPSALNTPGLTLLLFDRRVADDIELCCSLQGVGPVDQHCLFWDFVKHVRILLYL